MTRGNGLRRSLVCACLLTLGLTLSAQAVQGEKEKKKKGPPRGTPVLWRDPGNISALDLYHGAGGRAMRPDTRRLTFIEEEKGGYSKKYRVRDGRGRVWVAKVGKEAQPETAATRLLWAAGYLPEITYLVPRVNIPGKGTFENVRFEARPGNTKRHGEWRWEENPFAGTRELQGLKIMMALFENWDLKDSNNRILAVSGASGTRLQHVVSDLGATFGKTGGQNSPMDLIRRVKGSRNEPEDYARDRFIEGVEGGRVKFNFSGKNSSLMRDITVGDARWLSLILSRLSERQIADAFRAANYTPAEVRMLTAEVRQRIDELTSVGR